MRLMTLLHAPLLERAATVAPSAGLLVLRVVVGMTFLLHGLDKLGDALDLTHPRSPPAR